MTYRPDQPERHGDECRWHVIVPNRGWLYHYPTFRKAFKMYWHLKRNERFWLRDDVFIKRALEPRTYVAHKESDDSGW